MAKQHNTLAHTKWMFKYHIVFIPKYRQLCRYINKKPEKNTIDVLKKNICNINDKQDMISIFIQDAKYMAFGLKRNMEWINKDKKERNIKEKDEKNHKEYFALFKRNNFVKINVVCKKS